MSEDTSVNGDADTLAKMHASIDKLCRQNQTLEDKVHNI